MEDMAPAALGDQVAGGTLDQARHAVRACAQLNAQWWENPGLDTLSWLPALDAPDQIEVLDSWYQASWEPFLANKGESVSAEVRAAGAGLARDLPGVMHRLQQSPAANTLIHGDLRLDNMFFGGADMPVALVDWQLTWRTTPGLDLAWLLNQSLPVTLRRAHEAELLDLYLAELAARGVRNYTREQLWEDYKLATLFRFLAPVVVLAGDFDMGNERGLALAEALFERNAAAIEDHHLEDLI
jgi:Ser/Thr protein kinase RdoA (MazF antagonist)